MRREEYQLVANIIAKLPGDVRTMVADHFAKGFIEKVRTFDPVAWKGISGGQHTRRGVSAEDDDARTARVMAYASRVLGDDVKRYSDEAGDELRDLISSIVHAIRVVPFGDGTVRVSVSVDGAESSHIFSTNKPSGIAWTALGSVLADVEERAQLVDMVDRRRGRRFGEWD